MALAQAGVDLAYLVREAGKFVGDGHDGVRQRVRLAEEPRRGGERIDADVEERTARELRVAQPMLGRTLRVEGEVDVEVGGILARGLLRESQESLRDGKETRPHRFHQESVRLAGGARHTGALGLARGERLLAQHVSARPQQGDRIVGVARVGRGDVDGVDARIGGERGVLSYTSAGASGAPIPAIVANLALIGVGVALWTRRGWSAPTAPARPRCCG